MVPPAGSTWLVPGEGVDDTLVCVDVAHLDGAAQWSTTGASGASQVREQRRRWNAYGDAGLWRVLCLTRPATTPRNLIPSSLIA